MALDFSQLFIADAPMKKKSTKFVLSPRRALLGQPVQKYFVTPYKQNEDKFLKITYMVKRVCGVHF